MLFLGRSQAILRVLELIDKAARSSSTVLIIGESGVGKDVAANEIHRLSGRTERYLPKNCAAFGEGLIESELFGHERGAFTSAVDRRPGIFEQANGGTVFLDEITEMKLELQAKLLRVLEERQVTRLGGHTPIPVNVRVIAASNRPMQEALAVGKLRPDLYYRLKVFQIPIPPLRERLEDLELLVVHFIEEINREQSKDVEGLDDEALALLKAHTWPGNVREFRNESSKPW
jgi:transcriptional regulator with PAS, ATPase and Fis domain